MRLTKVKLFHPFFSFLTLPWLVFNMDGLCNTHLNLRLKVPKVFRSTFNRMIMQRIFEFAVKGFKRILEKLKRQIKGRVRTLKAKGQKKGGNYCII